MRFVDGVPDLRRLNALEQLIRQNCGERAMRHYEARLDDQRRRMSSHSIRRELVLYKVRAKNSEDKNEIIQIANIFRGSIIDVSKETLTLSVIGDEKKTDAVQELLEGFGIVELVRTGMIALERGKYTIDEDTKEKGEFNYGKDVL